MKKKIRNRQTRGRDGKGGRRGEGENNTYPWLERCSVRQKVDIEIKISCGWTGRTKTRGSGWKHLSENGKKLIRI